MTLLKIATESRKFGVALAGVLVQVIELGLVHGTALHYAQVVSGVLAALLVHYVPNTAAPAAPTRPAAPAEPSKAA